MSTTTSPYRDYFRRRTIGRAASPPTWACYEQIPYDDEDEYSDSGSESCSEDEEDYSHDHDHLSDWEDDHDHLDAPTSENRADDSLDMDMDIDEENTEAAAAMKVAASQKDVKGKQKAIEPEPEPAKRRHRKRDREHVYTLRPILTIQRSQGFVWNQDLFVPPYIKDRCSSIYLSIVVSCIIDRSFAVDVASMSPPNSAGFISTSVSSTNSALNDYEVEVVEIRVQDGDLDHIIP
ncbi:uncharacterized protein BT62DRAFT_933746 [Guyanagaster necrorhizus]|uniref:Uncharacterized protein n=1 Tax=Guyanagaster necrorhizus TaxID=856835 RepID=A0A9P7VQA4_9AGAR|nr:uncharacterized protein BT62DRAFT_933746 [Guyanagaster necrorhizus MCA 3950]KAG7444698.1 hypothetical protein BT62DRAFT_933746 [Guyanagaster necrorhizus MCA 3950]